MTYYGDGNGAVTDLEQNRLDVMPSDTLDVPGRAAAAAHERRARLPLAGDRPRVLGLQPRAARDPRVHKERRPGSGRSARRWPGRSTARKLVQASLLGYGAPGNTQLSRSYGRFTLDLSNDPVLGYHYDPRARPAHPRAARAGASAPTASGARTACAPSSSSPTRASTTEKRAVTLIRAWARDVGIQIDVRVYDTDKLHQPRVQQGRQQAHARLRHARSGRSAATRRPSSCSRCSRRPRSASGTTRASPNTTYEQLYKQELRATDDGTRVERHPQAAAHRDASSCRTSSSTRPTTSARSTRAPGQNWTTQPSPGGQPITVVRLRARSSRCSPGALATPSYPGVPWALAGLVALAALAAGSSFLAHRREQREPIEIAGGAPA